MVSIIIPHFNRFELLSETINNLKKQTISDWECIIIDDRSTDDSFNELLNLELDEQKFRLIQRPENLPKGPNSCRNLGLSYALGDFIKWVDSDDFLAPNALQLQLEIMESNPQLKVCFGKGKFIDSDNFEPIGEWPNGRAHKSIFTDYVANNISWPIGGGLWRRDFLSNNPFKVNLKNSQEWLMHGQQLLKLKETEIYILDEVVYLAKRGHQSISSQYSSEYLINMSKSRFFLLLDLLRKSPLFILPQIILIKKVIFYFLIGVKLKFKTYAL